MKKNAIILVLVLVFIAIVVFLDLPAYDKFVSLGSEIERYGNLLKEREEFIIKVSQLKEIYESRAPEIRKVYYSLPSEKDIPGLIVQFEALASENGLILEKLKFFERKETKEEKEGGVELQKSHKTLNVILSVTGGYQSFRSFLEALEFNIRIMDIKSIEFSSKRTEEEEERGLFTFNVELEVYYQ